VNSSVAFVGILVGRDAAVEEFRQFMDLFVDYGSHS